VLLATAPVALLAAGLLVAAVGESRDQSAPRRLDLPGAVTATTGLALVIFAITQTERLAGGPAANPAGAPRSELLLRVAVPLATGLALPAAFVVVERRSPAPLVPSSIFRVPGLVAADLAAATLPVGLGALLFLGTLHLQQVLGYTALRTGLAYLALSLPVVAASPAAACLVTRLGRRSVAVAGLLLQAAGLLLLLRITPGGGFLTEILPGFVLVGAGAPIAWVPLTAAAVDGVGDRSGLAAGIFNTAQQVGNALALAVLATVAAARTSALTGPGADAPTPSAMAAGFRAGFLVAAALCLLGALAALRLRAGVEGGPGPPLQRSTRGPGPRPSGRAPVDGPNRPPACR
jgi:hypothetical protein